MSEGIGYIQIGIVIGIAIGIFVSYLHSIHDPEFDDMVRDQGF
jgi:hypothetical protein